MKKILSLVLAAAICASMTTVAFATSGYGKVDPPSANVDSTGSVKSETVVQETEKAVAEAVKAGAGAKAEVVVKNAATISPKALQEVSAAATKAGGSALVMADTVVGGAIAARVYIDPAKAATLKEDIKLTVKVDESSVQLVKSIFSNFENKIAVAKFDQVGSFGMSVNVAVKLDLTDMDTKNLKFYTYDIATNKYLPLAAPAYWIDKAGYVHFTTDVGGSIVVSNGALALKK